MKLLDIVKRELNPKHDFDRVGRLYDYQKYRDKSFIKGFSAIGRDFFCFYVNAVIKHGLRYGLPMTEFGGLLFYAAGGDPDVGAKWIGGIVAGIDVSQYAIRGAVIPLIKVTHADLKTKLNIIKNSFKKPINGIS